MSDNTESTKTDYLMRCFRHTHNKDRENYVVLGIWHRLRMSGVKKDIQPITQQYVKRAEGGYALLDLYFPAIKLAVECDEAFHKNNELPDKAREHDVFRSFKDCGIGDAKKHVLRLEDIMTPERAAEQAINADMVDVNSLEIARVDASLSYEEIDAQLDFIVKEIKKRFEKAGCPNWDCRLAEDIVAEKGKVVDHDTIIFKTIAAILKGLNIRKGDGSPYTNWWKGGFPIGPSKILWFPHLSFRAGGWNNVLSEDGKVITESRNIGDKKQKKIAKTDWLPDVEKMREGQEVQRCVFAHSKNALGESGYRFMGVYKLIDTSINQKDKLPERMIFQKCACYMDALPEGSTYYRG